MAKKHEKLPSIQRVKIKEYLQFQTRNMGKTPEEETETDTYEVTPR